MRSRRPIPPHRTLRSDDVALADPGGWRVSMQGDAAALVDDRGVIPNWQPGLGVCVSNVLKVAPDAVERLSAYSAPAMELLAVLVVTTADGLATVTARHVRLARDAAGGLAADLDVELDGRLLARDIRLECSIVLGRPTPSSDRLTPRTVGSRVWVHTWRARLEGGKARLPIDVVPFSRFFRRADMSGGLVHVELATDPALDIEQGLIVYLNGDYPDFVERFARGEAAATALVWDAVIRRVLICGADAGFDLNAGYVAGSIGSHWCQWMGGAFPGLTGPGLLERHRSATSEFEVRVQAWTGMAHAFLRAG